MRSNFANILTVLRIFLIKDFEVFNLENDPQEMTDISRGQEVPDDLLPLKLKLEVYSREVLSGKGEIKIDEKTQEMLRALGYIW